MTQFDFTGSETQRRGWDQCDALAPNEQSEPDPKRQCIEHSWTTQDVILDKYPSFSNVGPLTHPQNPEVSLRSDADFEDVVPASNFDLMDFFNVENEDSSDLVQKSSGFYLETPQAPDPTQSLPTPNSDCDSPDVKSKVIASPGTLSKNVISTPQSFVSKPYDTCFGMIMTSASCHSLPNDAGVFIPVNIQVIGDVLKLFGGKANRNVGLLNSPALGNLIREFTATFSAKCEKTKENKNKMQSLGYQDTPHPTQGDASVPYLNPQFLVSPGTEMPQIEDLANVSLSAVTTMDQCSDEKWASEVFQTFESVDGPAEFDPVEPSQRLRTKLKEHQIKALSMMTERERGVIEEADFPSLWEVHRDFDGNVRYRHAVTGITQNIRPQAPAGGILADEMGLGKTLSVLALIAWYLDGLPLESTGPSTTLIITTLSRTPIHNRLDDYAALISFVRVSPFTGPHGKVVFAQWLENPVHTYGKDKLGIKRLKKLVAATCLRRTKSHVQGQLKLPLRVEKEHLVELDSGERSIYDFLKARASSLVVGKFTQRSQMDKARWGTMLSLIGFLRLICNHGEQLLPNIATELYHSQTLSAVDFRPSSKVNALLRNLQNEQRGNISLSDKRPVKSVIFSFWTKMLDLLEVALEANNFVFRRIDGKTPLEKRSLALTRFNEDSRYTVMLASIGSVAEGVDLTAASCIHMVEPQWNPMVEAQALDRVHRIGQDRNVTITRYIVKDSIELYVQAVQQTKLQLVQQSFSDEIPDQLVLSEKRFGKLLEILE
ncbi:Helicase C-terminal [Penicillium cf. viridicatum]|uniref:Helicase C-terminal n=1 Tax=Penicillium cf. viridicatum TaxID=2972119 RepID=A0A9W9M737_9EURO|nr:Helicase C-terminal [Penicillium cf. viridicatum]